MKRQREQAKREKQQMKLERRAQRASEPQTDDIENVDLENGNIEASEPDGETVVGTDSPRPE